MTGATWRSAFVAALFAVHPLRVESVAWIAERKDVLSGVFFMLTLRSYTRWVRNPEAQGYAWVVTWFGLGLLSKPMLVTAPCVLLLVDYWPLERLQRISGLPGLIAEKGWLFALSAASCLATIIAQRYAIQPIQRVSMSGRAANAVAAYAIYIIKMIAPVRLAVLYPAPVNGWPAWEVAAAAAGLVLVTVLVVLLRRRDPALVMGWFWYLGMLVPVIGIMQVGEQAYADRYTYLPGIGLMIGGVWAVERWTRKWRYQRAVTVSAAAVLLSLLMALAWRQTGYWRDSETLWRHAINVGSDGAVARNSLGNALLDEGEIDPAMEEYRAALRISPDDFQASYNLGNALLGQRRLDEAIAAYKQALRANPDYPLAHNNLGVALFDEGLNTEAVHEWKEATRIDPGFPPAEANLQRHAQRGLPGKGN
jgi:tetratricopeptide (TPR) repeat protein